MKGNEALPVLLMMLIQGVAANVAITHSTIAEEGNYQPTLPELDFDHREMEQKLKSGDISESQIPHHLVLLDENGKPVDAEHTSRMLSPQSYNFSDFSRLDCNPSTFTSCTETVSGNLPSGNNPLVIPCGECYTFDMTGNVTFAGGINILGKLAFPVNHQANIHTPFVFVQGELELTVDTPKVSPENKATSFILTGTEDVIFQPTESPNQNACDLLPEGKCNMGKKPFLIAGGKVNINAMSDSCTTHTPIVRKVYKEPSYNPEDFPQYVELPESCPVSGNMYISYDFSGSFGNWTGREGTFLISDDGNSLRVTNRKVHWQGPYLDITPMSPELCLVPNQEYLLEAR